MRVSYAVLAVAVAATAGAKVNALSDGFSATVYEGPTECDDSEKVTAGRFLKMHYTGTIDESSPTGEAGKQFDSSRGRKSTFDFAIGQGQVIPGWDKGLIGLCKGAKATLIIPAEDGYGANGAGPDIPGGATLNFDVEVVDVTDDAPPAPNLFKDLDANDDKKLSKEEVLAHFESMGQTELPEGLWESEDKDGNGHIDWVGFSFLFSLFYDHLSHSCFDSFIG